MNWLELFLFIVIFVGLFWLSVIVQTLFFNWLEKFRQKRCKHESIILMECKEHGQYTVCLECGGLVQRKE